MTLMHYFLQISFRKVHRKRSSDNHISRVFERGFLSADCGDMAPDDIGYFQLYKPDIEGRDTAICDYVFREPVILYSHDNIGNYESMFSDYMNVWIMMWTTGVHKIKKDITFINMDNMRRHGKFSGDFLNQFFK